MTIKEVAKQAGVSPAAVSRYFNGGSLTEEKKNKIRKVVEATGFRPNPVAQTMRTGRSGQVGVIVPTMLSDSVTGIMEGISEALREEDAIMILGCTDHDPEREVRLLEVMQENHVDGIILMGRLMTPALSEALASRKIPVVVTGQNFEQVSCVYHDDFHAMKELTRRMIRSGRRKLAYVGVLEEDEMAGRARREGMESALSEAGIDPANVPRRISEFRAFEGREAMRELLAEYDALDGILCATDYIALGVIRAIREKGLRVPEDIAVAGIGDSWAGRVSAPTLTTVHLHYRECGREAARLLMDQIRSDEASGGDEGVQKVMLGYEILIRESMPG